MIQPHSDLLEEPRPHRVLVPVRLRVPALADISVVADADLVAEVKRRGYAVWDAGKDAELSGLTVHADRPLLVWRGAPHKLGWRQHEVLLLLARTYPHTLSYERLTQAVWGRHRDVEVCRAVIFYLHRKLPGLLAVHHSGAGPCAIGLALDGTG
jgi:hypothetical protein